MGEKCGDRRQALVESLGGTSVLLTPSYHLSIILSLPGRRRVPRWPERVRVYLAEVVENLRASFAFVYYPRSSSRRRVRSPFVNPLYQILKRIARVVKSTPKVQSLLLRALRKRNSTQLHASASKIEIDIFSEEEGGRVARCESIGWGRRRKRVSHKGKR